MCVSAHSDSFCQIFLILTKYGRNIRLADICRYKDCRQYLNVNVILPEYGGKQMRKKDKNNALNGLSGCFTATGCDH